MQTWLFKALGAVAGLAGIALGVLLVLYRDIIAGSLLSKVLCPAQAYNVLLSIIVLVFGIAAVGIIAWVISASKSITSNISTAQVAVISSLIVPILLSVAVILLKEPVCEKPPIGKNTINIKSAEYAARRNVHGMSSVHRACQAQTSCNFACDNARADHGDPKEGDPKMCIVLYNCSFTPNYQQRAEADEGKVGSISCPQI